MDKQRSAGVLQGLVLWHSACVYVAVWGVCVCVCVRLDLRWHVVPGQTAVAG